jgi:hypothetical protein
MPESLEEKRVSAIPSEKVSLLVLFAMVMMGSLINNVPLFNCSLFNQLTPGI